MSDNTKFTRPASGNSVVPSTSSLLVDFFSPPHNTTISYQSRVRVGDIGLVRSTLLPSGGVHIGAEQVIVARHVGPPVKLEWRLPTADVTHSRLICRGAIHIKAGHEQFWQRWSTPAEVFVIAFDRNFFANLSCQAADSDVDLVGELAVTDPRLEELTALFYQELCDEGMNGRFYIENLGAALASYLVQRSLNRRLASVPFHAGLAPARLRRITDYIAAHLTGELGLTELADVADLNPHHLAHAFKVATGISPHRYIIERRIDKARRLLEEKHQPIAEIAVVCGFASQSHFTQHFHRIVGTTPEKFRRNL